MSRAAASTKTEKGKLGKTSSLAAPAVTREIISGKLNDHEWNLMLEQDDSDQFGTELVEEICNAALDIIHNNYLQKQLEPFTVMWAKDAFLQIIQWHFLDRDEGESNLDEDDGWVQDDEPSPAVIDCWAQGAVPQQMHPVQQILEEDEEEQEEEENAEEKLTGSEEAEPRQEEPEEEILSKAENDTTTTELDKKKENIDEEETRKTTQGSGKPSLKKEKSSKSSRSYRRHTGKLGSAKVSNLTESLDNTEQRLLFHGMPEETAPETPDPLLMLIPPSCLSTVKLQAGRPPGNRDVFYDEAGNVIGMTKIPAAKLPTHRVNTTFRVIDPSLEAERAKLDAMRTGKSVQADVMPHPPTTGKKQARNGRSKKLQTGSDNKAQATGLPPPLLESMEVAAGVVVKEGDRVKKGPKQKHQQAALSANLAKTALHPISLKTALPSVTVEQILGNKAPIIRPLAEAPPPVPPIRPHPVAGH